MTLVKVRPSINHIKATCLTFGTSLRTIFLSLHLQTVIQICVNLIMVTHLSCESVSICMYIFVATVLQCSLSPSTKVILRILHSQREALKGFLSVKNNTVLLSATSISFFLPLHSMYQNDLNQTILLTLSEGPEKPSTTIQCQYHSHHFLLSLQALYYHYIKISS